MRTSRCWRLCPGRMQGGTIWVTGHTDPRANPSSRSARCCTAISRTATDGSVHSLAQRQRPASDQSDHHTAPKPRGTPLHCQSHKATKLLNHIPCGGQILSPDGGFSIPAPVRLDFRTLFIIYFRVLRQSMSKISPAGRCNGLVKLGPNRSGLNVFGWNCDVFLLVSASIVDNLR